MKITPRRLSFGLLSLGLLLGASALASAKPAYVPSTVNLRAAPGTTSEVIAKIPGGSLVDASECSEGWCAVTWQDRSGFAIQSALDMSGRVSPLPRAARPPAYRGRVYSNEPDYFEVPPTVYYDPPPPFFFGYGPYYRRGWWRW
jgi:uncharacterized protein YraI